MHPDLVLVTSLSCMGRNILTWIICSLLVIGACLFSALPMLFASCWRDLLFICPMHCLPLVTLFTVWLLAYAAGILLRLSSKSASGSVVVLYYLFAWCCRYESAVTVVGIMYHMFLVMHLPFVVSWIVYNLPWWLCLPMSTIVPWVHSLLSSCWTTTAGPIGIYVNTGGVSLLFLCCLSMNLLWWSSSWSCPTGLWSRTGMMPQNLPVK